MKKIRWLWVGLISLSVMLVWMLAPQAMAYPGDMVIEPVAGDIHFAYGLDGADSIALTIERTDQTLTAAIPSGQGWSLTEANGDNLHVTLADDAYVDFSIPPSGDFKITLLYNPVPGNLTFQTSGVIHLSAVVVSGLLAIHPFEETVHRQNEL